MCSLQYIDNKSYSILQVVTKKPIKYLPERRGERYSSILVNKSLNNKVIIKKENKFERLHNIAY